MESFKHLPQALDRAHYFLAADPFGAYALTCEVRFMSERMEQGGASERTLTVTEDEFSADPTRYVREAQTIDRVIVTRDGETRLTISRQRDAIEP